MASVTDFFVASVDERLPIYADELIKSNVLLEWLRGKGCMKYNCGGDGFSFTVRKSQSGLVRAIGDLTIGQAKTSAPSQKVSGVYAAYGAEIQMSRLQMKRNSQPGNHKVFEMFEQNLNEAYQDFENYLGEDVTADGTAGTGDEATPITGLTAINDTDNTFMSIARGSNAWWQSQTQAVTNNFLDDDDADGVCNGLVAMRTAFLYACQGGGAEGDKSGVRRRLTSRKSKPDLVYSGLTSFNNYCLSLQPQQQYVNGGKNDPGQSVAFFGIPFEWDTYAQADRIDMLNSKVLEYRVIGGELIYRDMEDDLGLSGQPRMKAIGLVHQGQFYSFNPRLLAFVTNTD